ncbi:MAG: hypothetical protein KDK48_04190, partial [Chlamydiia bacterium]|nr:hypothetical protein [Chlamydiia bacterium]
DKWEKVAVEVVRDLQETDRRVQILWRVQALKVRCGESQNGKCAQEEAFVAEAKAWKEKQKKLTDRAWNARNEAEVRKLCKNYPKLVQLLEQSPKLKNAFFTWTVRDACETDIFAQFPATFTLFEKCALGSSFWYTGGGRLRIVRQENKAKVQIPVVLQEGRRHVWVWSSRKITLPKGHQTTMAAIFKDLRARNKKWPDYIFSKRGIENWNISEWSELGPQGKQVRWGLEKDRWFRQLPRMETLTLAEAKKRYGEEIDGTNYGFSLRATQKTPGMDIDRTHSFVEMLIPDSAGGYFTLQLGKFTRVLPQTFSELIGLIGDTVPASIASHDPNGYYNWRYQTWVSLVLNEQDFLEVAETLRTTIDEALAGKMPFSIYANSCSEWSQRMFNTARALVGKEPVDYFTVPLAAATPSASSMAAIVNFINLWPLDYQPSITRLCLMAFFPMRAMTIKEGGYLYKERVFGSSAWREGSFKNPGKLFADQRAGKVPFAGTPPDWMPS